MSEVFGCGDLLTCSVTAPHQVSVGDSTVPFYSGCRVIDVSFPHTKHVRVGAIHFKNHYCASYTLKLCLTSSASPSSHHVVSSNSSSPSRHGSHGVCALTWFTCVKERRLMPNPHSDQAAESYHIVTSEDLQTETTQTGVDDDSYVILIRFIVRQPSPMWRDFSLTDIRVYQAAASSESPTCGQQLPAWLSGCAEESDANIVDGTADDSEAAVSSVAAPVVATSEQYTRLSQLSQSLWATACEAGNRQPRASVGRFDVDGNYELNLLSYSS